MSVVTSASVSLRTLMADHRTAIGGILRSHLAVNPRLFGSVARGDATADSDIDLLVDFLPGCSSELMRVAGISEELSQLLGRRVDVVASSLLRDGVSKSAMAEAANF